MTFLLVDADRNFREVLAIALRLDGHTVVTAEEPSEALSHLARSDLGCCVVDANVVGGENLLAAAARSGARLVVTGVHASLLESTVRRHPRAEMLEKPFQAGELTRAR
jgi:DNA-binding NtrC family response regulator